MSEPTMIPEWVVLLVGRQALEIEQLRLAEAERQRREAERRAGEPSDR